VKKGQRGLFFTATHLQQVYRKTAFLSIRFCAFSEEKRARERAGHWRQESIGGSFSGIGCEP